MALTVAGHDAAALAAALARCPEAVCRHYLPHGRREGRYWVAGDLHGAKGRSLFVRLRPPGPPGRWTDAATGEHGDLLDLIRHRIGAGTLRPALDEARAFLALPVPERRDPEASRAVPPAAWDGAAAARRLWRSCRPLGGTHADAYLRARGLNVRRFPALRFHPALAYRDHAGRRRRFPALVAAVPAPPAAAALSAGSLAAFALPPGTARLLIAADRDAAGRRAAATLEAQALAQGIAATVLTPEGGDFNDDLAALGPQALAARLAPLTGPGPWAAPAAPRAHTGARQVP